MMEGGIRNSLVLGLSVAVGLTALGYTLGSSIIRFREFERTVSVKGLSEREAPADIALWPIEPGRATCGACARASRSMHRPTIEFAPTTC
jgi:hypothetical protein